MKHLFFLSLIFALPFSAQAIEPGTISLECKGMLKEIRGNFDDGFEHVQVPASLKFSGDIVFRYGTRMAYDSMEVNFDGQLTKVDNLKRMPEFHKYEQIFAYDNIFVTDLNWHQEGTYLDGSKFVDINSIRILGLPRTMTTTGDGEGAQDGNVRSIFAAKVNMRVSSTVDKTEDPTRSGDGILNCVYEQRFR